MEEIEIAGRTYKIVLPFGLDVLEDAADDIDEANTAIAKWAELRRADAPIPMRTQIHGLRSVARVIWHGIERATPGLVTIGAFESGIASDDLDPFVALFFRCLRRSGFVAKEGESRGSAAAPPARAASATGSARPSRSSPPRASAAAIGKPSGGRTRSRG